MKNRFLLFGIVFLFGPATLLAQSQLSRQLQQQLNQRKSATPKDDSEEAPSTEPAGSFASLQAKSPQEFADALHLAVGSQDLDRFNNLISWETIVKKATSKLQGKPIEEFQAGFLKDVKGNSSLGANIIHSVKSGGTYEFLQLKKTDKTIVAIYRMLLPGGRGVNYHEYSLAKTKTGNVVASDIYVYLTGENLSLSIRRNLITALHEKGSSQTIALAGKDKLLTENYAVIQKLNEALSKSDAATARGQILKLPAELRYDKAIQTLTLNTYRDSSSFLKVLEGTRKASPDDVFMDMVAIDVLVRQKKYKEAITSIERINKKVGGDPYLKILHGRMLLNDGDEANGRRMITEAVSEDDGILSGYWNLVSFALDDKDHPKTLKLLKAIHSRFKIKFKDLREIPSYREFVKSTEYKAWTEYLESLAVTAPTEEPTLPKTTQSTKRLESTQSASQTNQQTRSQPTKK